jgi:hypothetical protein
LAASLLVGLTLLTNLFAGTAAQDAPVPHDVSLLNALGLPEVKLVATDADVAGAPAELEAGRYLVSMENKTAATELEVYIAQPPAGLTSEQLLKDLNAKTNPPPSYAYDVTFAGGPNSYGGQTDAAVVDLTAGEWWFVFDRYTDPETYTLAKVKVTGTAAAAPAVAGAVQVKLREYTFEMPDQLAAGEQIWQLTNTGTQPHFFVLFGVPAGTTANDLMKLAMSFDESATPAPSPAAGGLTEKDFAFVYDSSFVWPGHATFVQVGLKPGTYGLFCWFPDKDTGLPHVMMGMVGIFTVA